MGRRLIAAIVLAVALFDAPMTRASIQDDDICWSPDVEFPIEPVRFKNTLPDLVRRRSPFRATQSRLPQLGSPHSATHAWLPGPGYPILST